MHIKQCSLQAFCGIILCVPASSVKCVKIATYEERISDFEIGNELT